MQENDFMRKGRAATTDGAERAETSHRKEGGPPPVGGVV